MKKTAYVAGCLMAVAVIVGGPLVSLGGEKHAKSSKSVSSDSASSGSMPGVSTDSGISVNSVNGQTTVTYKGEKVWSGHTSRPVSALSSNDNGTEYAAAFDGKKVLWENTSGAAEHLKSTGAGLPSNDQTIKKIGKKHRSET